MTFHFGVSHGINHALAKWLLIAVLGVLTWPWLAIAETDGGPIAPCGSDASEPNPAFTDTPSTMTWHGGETLAGWAPGTCIEWGLEQFTELTALASRFPFDGTVDDLISKFAAQSAWRGIKYWSVTDAQWKTLITDASALSGADPRQRRLDFTLPELTSGTDLYILQSDNRSSAAVVYRMRVVSVDPSRLIINIKNVSAVSFYGFALFNPGDLESTYIFVKLEPTTWGYYNLSGARERHAMFGNHSASYVNRAIAIYRHLTGNSGD